MQEKDLVVGGLYTYPGTASVFVYLGACERGKRLTPSRRSGFGPNGVVHASLFEADVKGMVWGAFAKLVPSDARLQTGVDRFHWVYGGMWEPTYCLVRYVMPLMPVDREAAWNYIGLVTKARQERAVRFPRGVRRLPTEKMNFELRDELTARAMESAALKVVGPIADYFEVPIVVTGHSVTMDPVDFLRLLRSVARTSYPSDRIPKPKKLKQEQRRAVARLGPNAV